MARKNEKPERKARRESREEIVEVLSTIRSQILFYTERGQDAVRDKLVAEQTAVILKAQRQIDEYCEQHDAAPKKLEELRKRQAQYTQRLLKAKNFSQVNKLQETAAKLRDLQAKIEADPMLKKAYEALKASQR